MGKILIDGVERDETPEEEADRLASMGGIAQPTLNVIKALLRTAIDAAAETERLKYITPGAGQAMTYQAKAAEAKAFLAAEEPQAADFPLLSAEVGITADSLAGVAQIVAGAYSQWQVIGAAIEATRLGGKASIEGAADAEAAQAAFEAVNWPAPQAA